MTLREAARRLQAIAGEVRDVAGQLGEPDRGPHCWAAARDLRAVAFDIEHRAAQCERIGREHGEADPDDTSWVATAAPGELQEVFGR